MEKNFSPAREKKEKKLIVRLMLPMLLLILFELIAFFAVLALGGEFSYIKNYVYSTLEAKTENRKNYLEASFRNKIIPTAETAEKINAVTEDILRERGAAVGDIKTDKDLSRYIVESSVDEVTELMRRTSSNDVFLILDTGELFKGESGGTAKAALYLRDLDPSTDGGFEDLLMETGFSSVSKEFGIILDSGWKLYFEPDPDDTEHYDYYYKTLENARLAPQLTPSELGYWSSFSKISPSGSPSMKYTVPLISEEGEVYGVLGVGITENNLLSDLPTTDFTGETACYLLGRRESEVSFHIDAHSGASYAHLVGAAQSIVLKDNKVKGAVDFEETGGVKITGCVSCIGLYDDRSPYRNEQWALITVGDKKSILAPLTALVQMLIIAAAASLCISIVVMVLSGRQVVKPVRNAIDTMNRSREYNNVIRFDRSGIYEIDALTDAITQLQINVLDFSSQVSKMISIADVGLGTFMYDRRDNSVFVGQSLLKFMSFPGADKDMVMNIDKFIGSITIHEIKQAVTECLSENADGEEKDAVREFSIADENNSLTWMRLSIVHNKSKSIGILQDITGVVMEKKRIEYERDYDSTTGLLNRHAYYKRIEQLFREPEKLRTAAFIMVDLDNLKYVNDTYGHDFGDDYIKTAANTLKHFQKYGGTVSRLSGDEFSVFLPGFDSKDALRAVIGEVREILLKSYCLLADGTHYRIRASAGVAWYPDDSQSYEMLMKYSDFAMYIIKHSTKGEIAEFDAAAYAKDSVLITGVEEMNRIIDESGVQYAFHSIVSAKTGEVYGYEALMRPASAILRSPMELLRIAKTGAKLYEIERLTWTKALASFDALRNAGKIGKNCHVFINSISNCSLEVQDVETIEKEYSHLLDRVVLEILETESMNEEYTKRKLNRMKKWNAGIALDDFGTGYSSEYALITMQPDIIKIDRSIISGCDKDISRQMIINSLIKVARSKNILVLAEGVETEEELRTVITCGVDLLQGFYIDRPVFEPMPVHPKVTDTIMRCNRRKVHTDAVRTAAQ